MERIHFPVDSQSLSRGRLLKIEKRRYNLTFAGFPSAQSDPLVARLSNMLVMLLTNPLDYFLLSEAQRLCSMVL